VASLQVLLAGVLGATLLVPMGASAQTNRVAEARLKEKNIVLPAETASLGNYVNAVQTGNLLYVSGTIAGANWSPKGKLGKEVTPEQGYQAARQAGINSLARVRGAIGSLDRVKRVVKVVGMVNSAEDFSDQPKVVNGVSDLLVEVFGESVGRHARSAVGMAGLPGNSPVEVELILEGD
jgi:enamine deaminase RidA (YjgF/YER057c/UK114 family)